MHLKLTILNKNLLLYEETKHNKDSALVYLPCPYAQTVNTADNRQCRLPKDLSSGDR
jgi:hypothetical protein